MLCSKSWKRSQGRWLWGGIVVLAVVQFQFANGQYYSDACWSINNELGTCVPLSSCSLFSGWLKMRPLVKDNLRMLVKYTCYFDNINPKVCCPNENVESPSQDEEEGFSIEVRVGSPVRRGIDGGPPPHNKLMFPGHPISFPSPTSKSRHAIKSSQTQPSSNHHREHTPLYFPSDGNSERERGKAIFNHGKGKDTLDPPQKKDLRLHPNFKLIPQLSECSSAAKLDSLFGVYGAYPWIALVGVKRRDSLDLDHVCGGVIINSRYIITAAHCFNRANPKYVRLGEYDLDTLIDQGNEFLPQSRREDYRIEKKTIHPDYNPAMGSNDIALIRVDREIALNATFIKAICLPFMAEYGIENRLDVHKLNELEGKPGWIAGWSRHSWDAKYSRGRESSVLQEGIVEFTSHDRCRQDYPHLSALNARSQLCVGGKGRRNSCSVDSGGPLMYPIKVPSKVEGFEEPKFFMLGLLSKGPTGRMCQNTADGGEDAEGRSLPTSVYTRVSKYLLWILDNLQE